MKLLVVLDVAFVGDPSGRLAARRSIVITVRVAVRESACTGEGIQVVLYSIVERSRRLQYDVLLAGWLPGCSSLTIVGSDTRARATSHPSFFWPVVRSVVRCSLPRSLPHSLPYPPTSVFVPRRSLRAGLKFAATISDGVPRLLYCRADVLLGVVTK